MSDYEAIGKEIIAKVDAVEDKYQQEDEAKNLDERRKWNRASALGWAFDCPRHLCLNRLCPEKEVVTPGQRRRFREGKLQESMLKAELRAAGVQFDPDPKPLLEKNYLIKGQADDLMVVAGKPIPTDYKSASGAMYDRIFPINGTDGLIKSPQAWIRHYPTQVLTYNYLYDQPGGFLFFKNKEGGHPVSDKHLIWVARNDKYMAELLAIVAQVNDWVKREDPPAAVWIDSCKSCGFMEHDFKPEERVEKVEAITDEELMALLDRRESNLEAHKQYEADDEEVKRRLKLIDRDKFLIGDYLVQNTKYNKRTHEIPEDIKKQYEVLVTLMRTTIKLTSSGI